ncbi:MAG TPA: hypothetical protein PL190_03030 [Caldisericia bacterium]|nr:MAG: hypothetical protein BWX90_01324 [bacterium ADurb.Bin132]HNW31267.1 hypothetical protein [Caldisericia bacterium]HNY61126.1 hypothetical protein [Caldisericia bacterium]HOC79098.1 hypothetical protein [Caldisericia bacterium]HOG70136.1 hypothetical protein [Caldisericia bacterium]
MKSDLQTSVGLTARMPYRLGFKAAVAGVCASEGDLDTSYRLLLECLLLNPNFIPAQETIAVNRLLASEPVIALREFKNVLRTNPSSKVGLWGKGLTLCILGRHEDALDTILEMAENQEMSEAGLGLLKRYFGIEESTTLKVSSVIKSFTENLSSNRSKTAFDLVKDIGQSDQSARLKLILSDLLFSRGERKTAKNLLEKMLDVHPYYPGLLYKLAKTSKSEGEDSQALEFLQTVTDCEPAYPDPDGILSLAQSSFAQPEDIEDLKLLRQWCIDVIKNTCIGFEKHEEPQLQPISQQPPEMPISSTNAVEIEKKLEETQSVIPEPQPEETVEAEPQQTLFGEEEPPSREYQEKQLERTRKILEEARKMLDQTKHVQEEPQEEILIDQNSTEEGQQEDVQPSEKNEVFEATIVELEARTDEDVPSEPVIIEGGPKRIVLPTSDLEPELSESRAWSMLRDGEAEEAFLMFSKLLRKEAGIESDQ